MIENEQQYSVTKEQVHKFEQALIKLNQCSKETKQENLLLWQVKKSALESQLDSLREEIEDYRNFHRLLGD